jgi:hypothetical protein
MQVAVWLPSLPLAPTSQKKDQKHVVGTFE